jgi:hypothetical protein
MKRILLPLVAFGLLVSLAPSVSEAGHRRFSVSIGFRPVHVGPYFYSGYGRSYWGGFPIGPVVVRTYERAGGGGSRVGAISLKVRPKSTEIYVDGQPIGRAGKYDGYPGYLWLDSGSHELVFHKEGFRTFARRFEVRTGMVTEVRVDMERGESDPPPSREMRSAPPQAGPATRVPTSGPTRAPGASARSGEVIDLRSEGGRIRVLAEPADASIYLDGRFIGTGTDLSRLRDGLILDEGEHELEAVHPNFVSDRLTFRVKAGEDLELRLTLEGPDET